VPKGVITFRRFALPDDWRPKWIESQAPLCKLHIETNSTIEEMHGLLQVDFANEFIVSIEKETRFFNLTIRNILHRVVVL
jgi:hypothetical protein